VIAITLAAAAVIGVVAHIAATIAEQDDQQDDPTDIATAETIVIIHSSYLREITCGVCRSFQVIPKEKKCYNRKYREGHKIPSPGEEMGSPARGGRDRLTIYESPPLRGEQKKSPLV
jgi:hypothetical protein